MLLVIGSNLIMFEFISFGFLCIVVYGSILMKLISIYFMNVIYLFIYFIFIDHYKLDDECWFDE
jgi:hypothetical protein